MINIEQIINNINIDENVIKLAEELEKEYLNYVCLLESYDQKFVKKFLNTYKKQENIASQEMEGVSNLEALFVEDLEAKSTALDYVINILKRKEEITQEEFKKIHGILMKNDQREYIKKGEFRNKSAEVGSFVDEKPIIYYVAPNYEYVPELIKGVLDYCNNDDDRGEINHPFIKAAIIHALVLHVQPFQDGNSRMGRLLHHSKLWVECNKRWNINMYQPILFFSNNYYFDRGGYRGKILNIDRNLSSSAAWNKWFNYNLVIMSEVFSNIIDAVQELSNVYSRFNECSEKTK